VVVLSSSWGTGYSLVAGQHMPFSKQSAVNKEKNQ
jgi:hypothetical protein